MPKTLDKILTFFRVSPIQQVIALGGSTPAAALCGYRAIENYSQGNVGTGIMNTSLALINIGFSLFNEYLAVEKMKEYNDVKSALEEYGWDERIIETKSHSWCQRNMVSVASDDSGFGDKTRNYLHKKGYRWYHFSPDV